MKFVQFTDKDGPAFIDPTLVTDVLFDDGKARVRVQHIPVSIRLVESPQEVVRKIEESLGRSVFIEFKDEDGPVFIVPEFVSGVFVSSLDMTVITSTVHQTNIHVEDNIEEVVQKLEDWFKERSSFLRTSEVATNLPC